MKIANRIWIVILGAVLIYVLMSLYVDFGDLWAAMGEFNPTFLPVLLVLTTTNHLLRFIKWDFFLKRVGVRLDRKTSLFVFFSGLSMTVTPAKSGEIWKGWLVKELHGDDVSRTVPVVIVERLADVIGIIILCSLGLLYYQQGIYFILLIVAILAGFYIAIRSTRVSRWLISILEKRAGRHVDSIKVMHTSFEAALEPRGLAAMSLLAAIGWLLEGVGLYLVVHGFGESIDFTLAVFIFSFASLAGGVSMLPGGLGVVEAGISGLLEVFDYAAALAVGVAIIVRLGTLWYSTVMGMLVYFVFRKRMKHALTQ